VANFKLDNSSDWETVEIIPPKSPSLKKTKDDDDWETVEVVKPKKDNNVARGLITAANGATFSMFPKLAGLLAGSRVNLEDMANAAMVDKSGAPAPAKMAEFNRKHYTKTKNYLDNEINDFYEKHPVAATAADFVGAVPTSMLIPVGNVAKGAKLLSKIKRGAKTGAAFGGLYGAGQSINDDASIKDAVLNTLKGAVKAGAVGAGMSGLIAPFTKTKLEKMQKAVGKNKVALSAEKGIPLLENADERTLQFAQGIKTRGNPKALQRFKNFEKKLELGQKERIGEIIDRELAGDDYNEIFNRIKEEGEKIYKPLYDKAREAGDIARPRTANSKTLKPYFAKARKYSDALKGKSDNNIEVLQRVKEKLDDDITKFTRSGESSTARDLNILKEQLIQDIDDSVLTHKEARQAYATTKNKQAALKRGLEDIPKADLTEIGQMKSLGLPQKEEEELLRGGAAQFFRNKAFNSPKTNANIYKNVFADDDLERLVKAKIISKDKMQSLRNQAHRGEKGIENIHRLTSGSQTAEKLVNLEGENPIRWVATPRRKIISFTDRLWGRTGGIGDARAAKYLTDPKALKLALNNKKPVKNSDILYKILGGKTGRDKNRRK
jgi:hypothetical protein